MSLEARLSQRQEQRLALLPHMLQSIEILQLATTDLVQMLEQELQANEVLELEPQLAEPSLPEPASATRTEPGDDGHGDDEDGSGVRSGGDGDADRKQSFLESQPAPGRSLRDDVRQQLSFRDVAPHIALAVLLLVEQLDDRGLLPESLDALAQRLGVERDVLAEALTVLQSLEPRGLGASSPIEAMLLQAQGDPDYGTIHRLLTQHLDAVARNKLPEVARALSCSIEELGHLLDRVRTLNPRPGASFVDRVAAPITPDAFVWLRDGEVQVALDDRALPGLAVNADYVSLAADRRLDSEVRGYLRQKLRSARDLIGAVQHRQQTLLRVIAAVMNDQRPFLERGRSALRPLRMSDVAAALGLHTSTVSRAIAGKHVQTERGVFRLREFFDGGRAEAPATEGQGRMAVAQRIADLVASEDPGSPWSDDELVEALARQGVQVARRTVAKYRSELKIPSSYLRRRHGEAGHVQQRRS